MSTASSNFSVAVGSYTSLLFKLGGPRSPPTPTPTAPCPPILPPTRPAPSPAPRAAPRSSRACWSPPRAARSRRRPAGVHARARASVSATAGSRGAAALGRAACACACMRRVMGKTARGLRAHAHIQTPPTRAWSRCRRPPPSRRLSQPHSTRTRTTRPPTTNTPPAPIPAPPTRAWSRCRRPPSSCSLSQMPYRFLGRPLMSSYRRPRASRPALMREMVDSRASGSWRAATWLRESVVLKHGAFRLGAGTARRALPPCARPLAHALLLLRPAYAQVLLSQHTPPPPLPRTCTLNAACSSGCSTENARSSSSALRHHTPSLRVRLHVQCT